MSWHERRGIFSTRRAIVGALKNGVLGGGEELEDPKQSQYIQYVASSGEVTVQVNGENIHRVTHIEHGRPCGVLILHTNDEDTSRIDYFPEEIQDIKIFG